MHFARRRENGRIRDDYTTIEQRGYGAGLEVATTTLAWDHARVRDYIDICFRNLLAAEISAVSALLV